MKPPPIMSYRSLSGGKVPRDVREGAVHVEEIVAIEPVDVEHSHIFLRAKPNPLLAAEPASQLIIRWCDVLIVQGTPEVRGPRLEPNP